MASMSASIRLVTGHSGPLRSRRRHVAPHTGPAASDRVAIQPVSRPRKVVVFTMSDCDHEVTTTRTMISPVSTISRAKTTESCST
jgi:hypothetical protein